MCKSAGEIHVIGFSVHITHYSGMNVTADMPDILLASLFSELL
jgi:hypothetical protein